MAVFVQDSDDCSLIVAALVNYMHLHIVPNIILKAQILNYNYRAIHDLNVWNHSSIFPYFHLYFA
jgi:hypothetical protein